MHNFDLNIDAVTKIEGHAQLDIKVRNDKVDSVHFKIAENKRFFTHAVIGQSFIAAPQLMSRICGTCSIAHILCCIKSIEKALEIEPSKQTMLLRELAMCGLMIRDHALHLYLFVLPDIFGKDSILDFDEDDEQQNKFAHDAFDVKKVGNNLSVLAVGKAVHAPFPVVGSMLSVPTKAKCEEMIKELLGIREKLINLIELFRNCDFEFKRKTLFSAQIGYDHHFLDGEIHSSNGVCIPEKSYRAHLERVVIPYSQAIGYVFEGKEYMVGSLARLNLAKASLHAKTKEDAGESLSLFPSQNVYHNNLAQAIEILQCVYRAVEILENSDFEPEKSPEIKPKKGVGVGVIEAPRGTLYYKVAIDEKGILTEAEVVVPSGQNQINIESDIKQLVGSLLDRPKDEIRLEIEKLIRAYDPCMSCATHFLKINWL